jgi:glycosyltransferase involved in cell wall biosynthesis
MLQLIRLFQKEGFQIEYATTAGPGIHNFDLTSIGIPTVAVRVNDPSFDDYVAGMNPEIVLFDRFMTEEQFGWRVQKHCPDALRLLDTEDLHCLRYAREAAIKEGRPFHEDDLLRDIAFREVASILRSDLTLMISSVEMAMLQRVFQVTHHLLHYLPFMENSLTEREQASCLPFSARAHFVSIGNFKHAPNLDGVMQLKEVIWPVIHAALPKVEMHIFGSYMPDQLKDWTDPKLGFFMQGRADDAQEVMGQYRLLLAPLRFGAGLKGKLIDAMRAGTPSVTTSIGAEGMMQQGPWCGVVEDDALLFAEKAVELYQNKATWNKAQSQCALVLHGNFNGEWHATMFSKRLRELASNLVVHRKRNVMGGLLWHHTLKSTTYMARWIETKEAHRT